MMDQGLLDPDAYSVVLTYMPESVANNRRGVGKENEEKDTGELE
jgi:hypothetical protein